MRKKINGIKTEATLMNGESLRINFTDSGFVKLRCYENGVSIKWIKEKPQKGYVVNYGTYGVFRMPNSIVNAYDLNGTFNLVKLSRDEYFIEKDTANVPRPFVKMLNVDDSTLDVSTLKPVYLRHKKDGTMRTNAALFVGSVFKNDFPIRKITVHTGTSLRIDVSYPSQNDIYRYPHTEDVKAEYGRQFQNYVGESITYIEYPSRSKDGKAVINIPKPFREKANLKKGDRMEIFEGETINGKPSYVIAPETKKCDIDGVTIDPKTSIPQEATMCDDCASNTGEVEDLLQEMKEIKEMMAVLTKRCGDVMSQNQILKDCLKKM